MHGFWDLLYPTSDLRTLFHGENNRRQALGGEMAAVTVAVPKVEQLSTNYRTHQGILDTAALLVVGAWAGASGSGGM